MPMPPKLLTNGRLLTPEREYNPGWALFEGTTIIAAGPAEAFPVPRGADVLDARGGWILPGLIDLHLHGAHGYDSAGPGLAEVIRVLPSHGITAFLPTTYVSPRERLLESVVAMRDILEHPPAGSQALGIHMEGPWFSPAKAGMGRPELFYPLTEADFRDFQVAAGGKIRMLTFAPEVGDALNVIPLLVEEGVIPSMGHTDADYETISRAVALGLNHAAHTYNAMRGLHHRQPGALGAALDHEQIIAELIADGQHVHPAAMRILLQAKGAEHICLVSDAAPPAGLPPGVYEWEGYELHVDGRTSRLADGTLAGSVTLINQMLRILVQEVGLSMREACCMATQVPADSLGVRKGRLAAGYDADIVVLGPNYEPSLTIIQGEIMHQLHLGGADD
jgi:N-acetylglucosamine-6-phosphate deacetylase